MNPAFPIESAEELYEQAPCGYLSTLPNGTIVRVNQTFLDWTGYTRTALLQGKRFQELLTIPGRIYHDTHYAPLLQMQGLVEEIAFDVRCPDRAPLPVLLNSRLVQDETGAPLLIRTTIFNATARRQYEYELLLARHESEHLAASVQASTDAIMSVTRTGLVQSWNQGAEQLFGYRADEAIGRSVETLIVPHDRRAEFAHTLVEMAAGRPMRFESVRLHKAGRPIDVSISLTPHIEAPNELVSISAILRDISTAKRTERELRQRSEELAERNRELAERNTELDAFVYTASHDLKEPLRGIYHYAHFLQEDYADKLDAEGLAILQALPQISAHLLQLLDTLLYYARLGRQSLAWQPVNVQAVLDQQLELLHLRLTESGVTVRVPHPLPTIQSDPILLGELFMNLITNAIKYNDKTAKWVEIGVVGETGDRTTEDRTTGDRATGDRATEDRATGDRTTEDRTTGDREIEAPAPVGAASALVSPVSALPRSSSPVFYVRDNGIGIAADRQAEIFQIFRRLHEREAYGGGIGAGLTIAQRIVERHGGRLWVESTPSTGTTFYFTLQAG